MQITNYYHFWFCFHRFLPSVLLQHVEDTMAISRLKWTVQTGRRVTTASASILVILLGKAASLFGIMSANSVKTLSTYSHFLYYFLPNDLSYHYIINMKT